MFTRAAIYQPPETPVEIAGFLKNARTEVFGQHLRNLIEFLYPDEFHPRRTSVCAHHFLASRSPYVDWLRARPGLSSTLRAAKGRADRELAHLTTSRIPGSPTFKYWDVEGLTSELNEVLVLFAASAATDRLGPAARSSIAALDEWLKR